MSIVHLKVKIKSLAAEARIIRHEESRVKTTRKYRKAARRSLVLGARPQGDVKRPPLSNSERERAVKMATTPTPEQLRLHGSLRGHRTGDVRSEARSALIAYGFLRGRTFAQTEPCYGTDLDGKLYTSDEIFSWRKRQLAQNPIDWMRVYDMVAKFGNLDRNKVRVIVKEWADTPTFRYCYSDSLSPTESAA